MASLTRTTRAGPTQVGGETRGFLALGRYRLHRPLGAGGFGTVWLARDERLDRDVAVKVLPRERIVGGRFEREARAAARLSHPGIVTLYEAAVDDDGAYLVSELVRGPTLAQLLEAGRLSDRDLVEIGIALSDALDHAHRQGVVHRDVKPSNVLVPERASSPAQLAQLTDFGVARVIGGDSLTRTGDVIGTAAYMAPEQAEGREAGASADLYSLALVLYEGLTGVNPIATGSTAQRARRLGAHLPPLRRQRRELPRELGRAIDLALRPRPRERGTLEELRTGLLSSLDEVEDVPGVVEHSWPARARPVGLLVDAPVTQPDLEEAPHPDDHTAAQPELPSRLARSERLMAAAAAGVIAGWLAADVLVRSPLGPIAAALLASVLVAVLPRIGWLALALASSAALVTQGRTGAAVVVLLAAVLPMLLLPRRPSRWPLAALAPALGVVGLAGAWPALAARGGGLWQRAALGALGWLWLTAAGVLSGHGLYTRLPTGTPPPSVWTPSPGQTVTHVLSPILSSGWLAPTVAWGLAPVLLAFISVRSAALRVVLVVMWSAALASTTSTLLPSTPGGVALRPNVLVLGAVAGGVVALAPALLRWRPSQAG